MAGYARSLPEQSRKRPGWPDVWGSRRNTHFCRNQTALAGVLRTAALARSAVAGETGPLPGSFPLGLLDSERLAFLKKLSPASIKRLASLRLEDVVGLEAKRARARVKLLRARYPSAGPREI